MDRYLLIESMDPMESSSLNTSGELAHSLIQAGHEVSMFFVENGVFHTMIAESREKLETLMKAGVSVWLDDFSIQERRIRDNLFPKGAHVQQMGSVVEYIAGPCKVLWY